VEKDVSGIPTGGKDMFVAKVEFRGNEYMSQFKRNKEDTTLYKGGIWIPQSELSDSHCRNEVLGPWGCIVFPALCEVVPVSGGVPGRDRSCLRASIGARIRL